MNTFDDSSHEMHDEPLTPEAADRLLDGEILSPEFADLASLVGDVRAAVSATPTPAVRGALAEYVGVGLTATEPPEEPPAIAAVTPTTVAVTAAEDTRRRRMFAEVLTFAGTASGKLLIGGALAAASVTGAQATGLVDLPGLTENRDMVVIADQGEENIPETLPLADDSAEKDGTNSDDGDETSFPLTEEERDGDIREDDDLGSDGVEQEPAAEPDKDEPAAEPKKDEPAAEPKKDEPAAEPKKDEPATEPKKDEPSEYELAAAALEAQLHADKEAVYAAASDLIKPLEAEKLELKAALETVLVSLELARNEAKAPLYEELEATEDPGRRAEIEAELAAIYEQWEVDRDAAIAAAAPAINEILEQLETIELERDAEINRLLEKFRTDLEALKG